MNRRSCGVVQPEGSAGPELALGAVSWAGVRSPSTSLAGEAARRVTTPKPAAAASAVEGACDEAIGGPITNPEAGGEAEAEVDAGGDGGAAEAGVDAGVDGSAAEAEVDAGGDGGEAEAAPTAGLLRAGRPGPPSAEAAAVGASSRGGRAGRWTRPP